MTLRSPTFPGIATVLAFAGLLFARPAPALAQRTPGQPIGTVTTHGNLAVLELEPGAVADANLFDLEERTLRFTPEGPGFRVEVGPLRWDAELGRALEDSVTVVPLRRFAFPISGRSWSSVHVNPQGNLSFGGAYEEFAPRRFAELREAGPELAERVREIGVPVISAFLKMRMEGTRYVEELGDRLVVTWDQTEPVGGIFDFTFVPTTNRFQAVLWEDGRIDLSYQEVEAQDAIVGVFTAGAAAEDAGGVADVLFGAGVEGAPAPVDLSARRPSDPPSAAPYEAFHHYGLPHTASMACSVIEALGDRFDFMVWYSDFRVDNQEGGTPSTGAIGRSVTGFGRDLSGRRGPESFCSEGRIQATYVQPVWAGANQAMERAPDGSFDGYDMAMSQVSHELGHRWSAFSKAIVDGDTIDLGPTHWALGLHSPVPYPYRMAPEASIMGGGFWQDIGNGRYKLLADNYYVPASGYSYLDLYLMGLMPASEVPDMLFLENLEEVDRSPEGNRIYTGDPVTVTIEDVVAHNGPRRPAYEDAQREYTTAMVALVLPGREPSPELLERLEGIRREWEVFFEKTTGGRATMETELDGNGH